MLPDAAAQPELRRPDPVHVAGATAVLVNGIFGDPLLHVRFRQARRSLLFDLGEAARLQARITHQVTDAFVTHAHFDHFAGFLWLLRSRIGLVEPCRVFGPPGLAAHAAGLVGGIRWDRVGDDGPRFEILELEGSHLTRFALQAGKGLAPLGERAVVDGVILEEPGFRVRAVVLDHGIEVMAYALEAELQANVRVEALRDSGVPPGRWLDGLKHALRGGAPATLVTLPDGSTRPASTLAHLVELRPGDRLVYATDFGDTPANRDRLVALARGAHTLFCEATFTSDDVAQARRTSHLTARACAEIAVAAGVGQLVPFHFSRRYEHVPERVYAEVRAGCKQALVPWWVGSGGLSDR
jgi:ribonuclease BN (tRNA processing enzyme)